MASNSVLQALIASPYYLGPAGTSKMRPDFETAVQQHLQNATPQLYAQIQNPGGQAPITGAGGNDMGRGNTYLNDRPAGGYFAQQQAAAKKAPAGPVTGKKGSPVTVVPPVPAQQPPPAWDGRAVAHIQGAFSGDPAKLQAANDYFKMLTGQPINWAMVNPGNAQMMIDYVQRVVTGQESPDGFAWAYQANSNNGQGYPAADQGQSRGVMAAQGAPPPGTPPPPPLGSPPMPFDGISGAGQGGLPQGPGRVPPGPMGGALNMASAGNSVGGTGAPAAASSTGGMRLASPGQQPAPAGQDQGYKKFKGLLPPPRMGKKGGGLTQYR